MNARTLILVAAAVASCLVGRATAVESLAEQYQKVAQQTLKDLRQAEARSVAVLRFAVRIGEGSFPNHVGTLNSRLADRFELALVMANPAQSTADVQQVGVIRDASSVAATIPGATHATATGRKLLFTKNYPLAWELDGQSTIVPDVFVVGVAQIHANLRSMDVELLQFSQRDLELKPLASFTAKTDLDDLLDSGESFTTRGLFDDGQVMRGEQATELVAKRAETIRNEANNNRQSLTTSAHPLSPSSRAPLKLEIFFNGAPQPIQFQDGAAFVKEPAEGQKISFTVSRTDGKQDRYGVLLQVNGENTLFRERNSSLRSSLWIMEPNAKAFGVFGYQMRGGVRQEFRVLSQQASVQRAIDYGRDVGLISIVVFKENKAAKPTLTDEQLDLAVQTQASLPAKTVTTRGQLGKSLFDQLMAQDTTRGLIAEGDTKNATVNTVAFDRDPIPVMAASIRYYKQ